MPFPTELSNAINGVTEIIAAHLNNLEAKVGIDDSAVATSLDYLLKNTGSVDPGHKHTAGALSGGSDGEMFYKAAGVWGPGTPDAAGLVAKSGDQDIAGIKTFISIPLGPDSNPTTDNHLARKAYVDLMLPRAGGTMAGNIAMNNYQVTGLAAASGTGEAVRFDEWTGGQDPGHKHSKLWAADGSSEAVTTDTGANVGIGKTPSLPYKLDIAGSLASSQTTTLRYVENGCELRTLSVATSSATHKPSPYSQWKASIWNGSTAAEKIMMSQLQGISGEDSQYFMETASSDVANILCLRGDTGYIGIGTNSPQEELQVVGNLFLSHKYKPGNPYGDHTSKLWMSPWTNTVGTGNYNALVLARYSFTNPFTIMAGPDTLNIINVINGYDTIFGENGYVGIGTTSPGKKLDVDGYLRGIGIFNTLNSAPADEDIAAGECALWFDKTDGAAKLMIKAKQNDGTVKTASISLN